MAVMFGTVKVPARITIAAGVDQQHELAIVDTVIELHLIGGPTRHGSAASIVKVDAPDIPSFIAQALWAAADDIEAQR